MLGGDSTVRLYASKCDRPAPEVDVIKIHHMQDEISIPGKQRWAPCVIQFYEPVNGSDLTAQFLNQWILNSVILLQSSSQGNQPSFKRIIQIQMEDGFGEPVWVYRLLDAWPSRVSPSTVDYSSSEFATIEATFEFSKAEEVAGAAGAQATSPSC